MNAVVRTRARLLIGVVAVAMAIAGCGGDDGGSDGAAGPATTSTIPAPSGGSLSLPTAAPPSLTIPTTPEGVEVAIPEDEPCVIETRFENQVLGFVQNSDVVSEEGQAILRSVVTQIVSNDATLVRIDVAGYASVEGDEAYNRDLSQRRANAVKALLVDMTGLPGDLVAAIGNGETGDDSPASRAASRRVEVRFSFEGCGAASATGG